MGYTVRHDDGSEWDEGYKAGYHAGLVEGIRMGESTEAFRASHRPQPSSQSPARFRPKPVRFTSKRKQTGKAKLLTQMTAPVWKKYKKGNGKKTYVQIRAQVSRSQAYKRKAKKL